MVQTEDSTLQLVPFGEVNSERHTAMNISEDEAKDALLKRNEDELRNQQKANSIQCVEAMRLSPKEASRSNEHFHVKTNMVHTLYRVKSVGCIPLVSLKIWLTEEEYRRCLNSPHINKTWYPLTTDVFVALLFRQEIEEASDDVARKYYDETPKEDRSDASVTTTMRAVARLKHQSFKGQFFEYLLIANPKFGDKFLEEITKHWSNNEKPEMSLEKLQLIATACVAPQFKVKWLQHWNSVFTLLEEGAVNMFSKSVNEDGLAIDMDVVQKSRSII